MEEFPQPTKNALTVWKITGAICSTIPGLSTIRELSQHFLDSRIELYQGKLIEAVRREGIEVLSDEQAAFYVPAAYRFFEQVRLGEYDHNLFVLAALIAGNLNDKMGRADVGRVGRAARKLELLSLSELTALVRCKEAFEISGTLPDDDSNELCFGPRLLVRIYGYHGQEITYLAALESLHELASRGLLTVGSNNKTMGGQYFFRNRAFDEIIEAALTLTARTQPAA